MAPQTAPPSPEAPSAPDAPLVVGSGALLLHQFGAALQKTARSAGIYARNNALLQKFLVDTYALMCAVHRERGDIELDVRSDKLTLGGDPVLQDTDRESGIPFRLYREGIRRFTLVAGMPREEMDALMSILGRKGADEDLVTMLWQAALPNVRYVTVDISSAAYTSTTAGEEGAEDAGGEGSSEDNVRRELDALLSAIYQGAGGKTEAIRGLSIGTDDLLALKMLGTPGEAELDSVRAPMTRALSGVSDAQLVALQSEANESEAVLMDRALDVLLEVMFGLADEEARQVVEHLVQLYDGLLVARDFRGAAGLVDRVRLFAHAAAQQGAQEQPAVAALLRQFIQEQRLTSIAVALNEGSQASQADVARLLASLAWDTPAALLPMLPTLQNPHHRRLLCDALVASSMPTAQQLAEHLQRGEWFVARDLLYLLSKSPDPQAKELVVAACGSEHPRIRQAAILVVGHLDDASVRSILSKALKDDDAGVRQAAVRIAGARKMYGLAAVLREVVNAADFADRDLGEIKSYLMAFAALGGAAAVDTLDRLLNPAIIGRGADLLSRIKGSVESAADAQKIDLRIAAAAALGSIDDPGARAALQKGTKSVIQAVKLASQKALTAGTAPAGGGGGEQP